MVQVLIPIKKTKRMAAKLARLQPRHRKPVAAFKPTLVTPVDPPAFRFRDALERLDAREQGRLAEARRMRAAQMAIEQRETVTLMADDANEKVRRVRVMDPVERAFRRRQIEDEHYRLARCVEMDVLRLSTAQGGGRLVQYRCATAEEGVAYALMPRSPSDPRRAQASRNDALDALRRVEDAIGPGPAYAVLRKWAGEGEALYALDAQWKKKRGWALSMVQFALARMADAQVYEREKWKIDVLAEAA